MRNLFMIAGLLGCGLAAGAAESVPLQSDAVLGSNPTEAAKAFDGNMSTYFSGSYCTANIYSYYYGRNWVGLDLGTEHVITRVGIAPRRGYESKARFAVVQGANNPDFSDALPLVVYKQTPEASKMNYLDINVSRGFRYVRVVATDGEGYFAEVEFYGTPGKGDDSQFYQVTNLPTVSFNTPGMAEIQSKDDKHPGSYVAIVSKDGTKILEDTLAQMKGRGNGSWTFNKKPFQIKFNKKQQPLDAPAKAKKWTLINNYGDRSLMRNKVAFDISREAGIPYTPYCTFVDVIYNGEYEGSYQLCDQVEVNPGRVEITEMTPEDISGDALTGGYFLEVDAYADQEISWFKSKKGVPVTIKSPDEDEITREQTNYITNYFNTFENALWASDFMSAETGYRKYFDLESFLRYFIVCELDGNIDSFWSMYMWKERGDELMHVGPVWDVDLGFNNYSPSSNVNGQNDFLYTLEIASLASGMRNFVNRIIKEDKDAASQLSDMWSRLRANGNFNYEYFEAKINEYVKELEESQTLNFNRWPMLDRSVQKGQGVYGSYEGEVNNVKSFLKKRFEKLDDLMNLHEIEPEPGPDPDPIAKPEGIEIPQTTKVVYNADGLWSISDFCCEEATGEQPAGVNGVISALIDNNPATYYHSQWSGDKFNGRHYFILDLGEATDFYGFEYTPRPDGVRNGVWYNYSAWMSDDPTAFSAVARHDEEAMKRFFTINPAHETGTLDVVGSQTGQTVMFSQGYHCRYILFVTEGHDKTDPTTAPAYSSGAELGLVVGDPDAPDADQLAAVEEALANARALIESYRASAPMASEALDEIDGKLSNASADQIWRAVREEYPTYIHNEYIASAETAVVEAVKRSAAATTLAFHVTAPAADGSTWTGYLSNVTVEPAGRNYLGFSCSPELDFDCAWTLEAAGTDGQYRFRTRHGEYIAATSGMDYCRVAADREGAALFTVAANNGHLTFPAVDFKGRGLSFDLENNPVELFVLTVPNSWWSLEEFPVPDPVELTVAPAAAETMESIDAVTLTVEGAESISAVGRGEAVVRLGEEIVARADAEAFGQMIAGAVCTWTLNLTADGEYTMTVPEGMFRTSDGADSKALTVSWTVDSTVGIVVVGSDAIAPDAEIYDLNGRRVVRPADGIYVVDGRKVFIRR